MIFGIFFNKDKEIKEGVATLWERRQKPKRKRKRRGIKALLIQLLKMSGGCWLILSPQAGLDGEMLAYWRAHMSRQLAEGYAWEPLCCSNSCECGPTWEGCVKSCSVWVIKARRWQPQNVKTSQLLNQDTAEASLTHLFQSRDICRPQIQHEYYWHLRFHITPALLLK